MARCGFEFGIGIGLAQAIELWKKLGKKLGKKQADSRASSAQLHDLAQAMFARCGLQPTVALDTLYESVHLC